MKTVNDIKGKRYSPEDFVFFWGHTDRTDAGNHPNAGNRPGVGRQCLSQWHPSPFVVDGLYYCCAEQFMMAEKACMFGDEKVWTEIMASHNPAAIKKLGRRVRNFNAYVWDRNNRDVVRKANLAKFSQNPKLRDFLLATGDRILVEASPYDTIWGIGLGADSPDACRPERWRGENRLGFILMDVRDSLRGKDISTEQPFEDVLKMWTMGAGNSARRFNMEDPMPEKKVAATADSWTTRPLERFVTVPQDFYLSASRMDTVRLGHIPDAMEDHWFMYCDDRAIRYYRSWTGICFVEALYEKSDDEYRITELRINDNPKEHRLVDVDAAVALFYALLISEYGGNSGPYWNAAF